MTLDPEVRDLLAAIVDLDDATRSQGSGDRSVALAFAAGTLRVVVGGEALPVHAASTIHARVRMIEHKRAAEATEAGRVLSALDPEVRDLLVAMCNTLENGHPAEVLGVLDYLLGDGSGLQHATAALREYDVKEPRRVSPEASDRALRHRQETG